MRREKEDSNIEFPNQKINDVLMEKEVQTSFIQYAMSVIMARALPDVRDGLKPVHRRILYAMYEGNHTHDKPFYKSASTVGDVLGHYHPHGDASVYDAMVRLAQPFSLRYPLIEGHGNFGNIDGDQAAAYRYTEARMSRLADEMLTDIEKNTIDFMPNFDNKRNEPTVLPSRFPNLLVNGSMGIAVGMATNIPPHNLNEVVDGIIHLMDHPEATLSDLMQFIKGPDFPTNATILGTQGIMQAYATGRGKITVRAKAEVDEEKRRIIVTEIPYGVNKASLVISMADCVKDKKIEGISEIRDETGKDGMRIVIEYKRDANGQIILNQLYKYTQLQDTFAANMLALVDNIPKVLTLKEMLELYINHQIDVVRRRTQFELNKALHDAHINEGYKIACDHIDEVITIIRNSESISEAKINLQNRFGLSEEQSQAIVDMTLGKLSGMERKKVEDRLAALYATIDTLKGILADETKLKDVIKEELLIIRKKFGDDRKTEIVPYEGEIIYEDLIEKHNCVITMSHTGYIKRIPAAVYRSQNRGGRGVIGMTTKEDDYVETCLSAGSHSMLLMFSNLGKVYMKKAYMIPEAGRASKGTSIVNVLSLEADEKITSIISVDEYDAEKNLMMVTKKGTVKKTSMTEFERIYNGGKRAITLKEDDELSFVLLTCGSDDILIGTNSGLALKFNESKVREMGRTAAGVRAIRLVRENDFICGAVVADSNKKLLVVTEEGYGKQVEFENFTIHNRGGKGMKLSNTERTGLVTSILAVSDEDDIMIITDAGNMIRTPIDGISTNGRSAGGVRLLKLKDGVKVVSATAVKKEKADDDLTEVDLTEESESVPTDNE